MWPRTEEEFARGHNSGFVAYMHRADAEAAYANLHERIDGNAVRLAWGKAVQRESAPRPPLPGQVYGGTSTGRYALDSAAAQGDAALPRVLVQPPLDLGRRLELSRLAVEALAAPGGVPAVAAAARASGRRGLGFLWEEVAADGRGSEDGNYFRWRMHSLANGGMMTRWRTAPLALVEGGPMWDPPTCSQPLGNPPLETKLAGAEVAAAVGLLGATPKPPVVVVSRVTAEGRSDEEMDDVGKPAASAGVGDDDEDDDVGCNDASGVQNGKDDVMKDGGDPDSGLDTEMVALLESVAALDERLDSRARAELHRLLDTLDTTNGAIARAMCFCIDQSRRAGDIAAALARRLLTLAMMTPPPPPERGLALLYLVTDILANGDAGGGAHAHRARLASLAPMAFGSALGRWVDALPSRIASAAAATGVARVLDAWEKLRVFDSSFVEALRTAALGTRARAIAEDLGA